MIASIENSWLTAVRRCKSPNCDARPADVHPELLVIHGISLPPKEYGGSHIEALFCNQLDPNEDPFFATISGIEVSAHLLIRRTGELIQFVSFDQRAWHAGVSCFEGRERCNDFSIGIELEGCDDQPYEQIQYQRLAEVSTLLMQRYPAITSQRIVGHCGIAPGRKTDPGEAFDWCYFRQLLEGVPT